MNIEQNLLSTEALFENMDWSQSQLGEYNSWPISLKNLVDLILRSPFPMFVLWGEHSNIIYNSAYATILGRKHPKSFGQPLEIVWPEIWKDINPLVKAVKLGQSIYIEDFKLRIDRNENFEDAYFTFSYSPVRDEAKEIKGLFCAVVETTKRKNFEDALVKSEASLKMALASAQMGTWQVDVKTQKLVANLDAAIIHGFDHINSEVFSFIDKAVHPEDQLELNKKWTSAVEDRLPFTHQHRIIRPDGQIRWIQSNGRIFSDVSAEKEELAGVVMDITDRINEQKDLKKARDQAEIANKAKSNFLANVSHEIRTPLGVIQGFAELLNDGESHSPEETRNWLTTIGKNAYQLTSLIDELLDLSKIEAEMLVIENIEFDLPEVIQDVSSLLSFKAKNKGIKLRIITEGSLPKRIISDPTRLRQILINIVGNAVKFTEWGGVDVRISLVKGGVQTGAPCEIQFAVKDTGIGILAADQERLFKSFSQADSTATRKFGGTGLGLYISKKLAQAMGGDLVLTSSKEKLGSVFTFTLRCLAYESTVINEKSPSQNSASLKETKSLAGLTILLVEDSADNRALVTRLLTICGATVDTAVNGLDGIQKALRGSHDVILMDIQMPELDGIEATKKLRAEGFKKPIIALTAHAMNEERERCLKSGFNDHVSKPIQRAALITAITTFTKLENNSAIGKTNE